MPSKHQAPQIPEEADEDALLGHLEDLDLHDMIIDDDSSEEGITESDLENSGLQVYEKPLASEDPNNDGGNSLSAYNENNNTVANNNRKASTSASTNASHYSSTSMPEGSGINNASPILSEHQHNSSHYVSTNVNAGNSNVDMNSRTTETLTASASQSASMSMSMIGRSTDKRNQSTSNNSASPSLSTKHQDYTLPVQKKICQSNHNSSAVDANIHTGMDNHNPSDDGTALPVDISDLHHPQDFYNLGAKLLEKSRTEGAAKSAAVARANYLKYMNSSLSSAGNATNNDSNGGGSKASMKNRRTQVPP